MLTTDQVRNQTKTVTRRVNWWQDKNGKRLIQPGDILNACVKCMGLKPGEQIDVICQIRVVDIRREELCAMLNQTGNTEAAAEGFPEMSNREFVQMFCREMSVKEWHVVTRIEFEYLELALC